MVSLNPNTLTPQFNPLAALQNQAQPNAAGGNGVPNLGALNPQALQNASTQDLLGLVQMLLGSLMGGGAGGLAGMLGGGSNKLTLGQAVSRAQGQTGISEGLLKWGLGPELTQSLAANQNPLGGLLGGMGGLAGGLGAGLGAGGLGAGGLGAGLGAGGLGAGGLGAGLGAGAAGAGGGGLNSALFAADSYNRAMRIAGLQFTNGSPSLYSLVNAPDSLSRLAGISNMFPALAPIAGLMSKAAGDTNSTLGLMGMGGAGGFGGVGAAGGLAGLGGLGGLGAGGGIPGIGGLPQGLGI